ncbi:hypothetical protein K488DRAFT_42011 [Vararia minispora EC-137]|uniref:Uncharacterized protein n=1 Tax=Vararia minispora EC-137 TaxID=1314806 RepID=A0ACB8QW72_9AGAM|nr:hypothetical protein K488DRAFT_42011 [Vararia minispora EC-137]
MSFTNSETRERRRQEVDRATSIQTRAALLGGAQAGVAGIGAATIAHYTWPWFRRQTLAGKAFAVSIVAIFGFVLRAESALLAHEDAQRRNEGEMRLQARLELSKRGVIATETEILKWQRERDAARAGENLGQSS